MCMYFIISVYRESFEIDALENKERRKKGPLLPVEHTAWWINENKKKEPKYTRAYTRRNNFVSSKILLINTPKRDFDFRSIHDYSMFLLNIPLDVEGEFSFSCG